MVQLGYRVADLYIHVLFKEEKNNDHWSMLLHHVSALCLVVCSWTANAIPGGVLIMFYHDCSDVLSSPLRVWSDTIYGDSLLKGIPIFLFYMTYLFTYAWSRLVAFPWMIIRLSQTASVGGVENKNGRLLTQVNSVFLGILAFLHYLWFINLC